MLDEMTQQNTSKITLFLEYENPWSIQGHSLCEKNKVAPNEKSTWVFIFQKYGMF